MANMIKNQGFTLVELVISIVVISLAIAVILTATLFALKHTPFEHKQTEAITNSIKCMEYFLGKRHAKGFASLSVGTTNPAICNTSGFTTSVKVENVTVPNFTEAQAFKLVTVETTDPGKSTLKLLISDY